MIPLRNAQRFIYKAFKQPAYAFKVFIKRMKAYASYYFAKGRSSSPEAVTIFLTHRCNLRCKMCGQWGEGGVTKKMASDAVREELSFAELKGFVDDVSAFRPGITLFGGEPLLYAGCIELIRYIKSKDMHCLMITNGSMLRDLAKDIVDAGLDELNVSLDGGKALHDEIRGMDGLFERIMGGLKEVKRCKEEAGKRKPFVNLQCTITKYNYLRLEELLDVAKEAGAASLTFHNLIFTNRDVLDKQKVADDLLQCTSKEWEGFIFEPGIDPVLLYKKISSINKTRHGFSVDFYPNFSFRELNSYYRDPCYVPSGMGGRCLSPWLAAYVFPDGEVRPCLNCSYSFGNIKNKKMLEAWNSDTAVNFRKALREARMFPACSRCTELYRY